MAGKLYVVTTPIGNLEDLTPRAARCLREADFIAAEDTRVTVKLLNHLGVKKPMISYHEHNKWEQGAAILARIEAGECCALCSDAGVPAISDPGEALVDEALGRGIPVVPVPGASAAVTALCVSGQPTSRFVFEGFLPVQKRQRAQRLEEIKNEERTLLFYEAPHKLLRTLEDLAKTFGAGRGVTLCRELTKLHEEVWRTTLGQALQRYQSESPRGEFVLVVAGAVPQPKEALTPEQAAALARQWMENEGAGASEAAKRAAKATGVAKSTIYKLLQE